MDAIFSAINQCRPVIFGTLLVVGISMLVWVVGKIWGERKQNRKWGLK